MLSALYAKRFAGEEHPAKAGERSFVRTLREKGD